MNISLSVDQADMLFDILTKYSNLKTDIIYRDSKVSSILPILKVISIMIVQKF